MTASATAAAAVATAMSATAVSAATSAASAALPVASTATADTFRLHDILRAVANWLEAPVVAILILLILSAAALLGWLVAEAMTERRRLKVKLPALLDDIQSRRRPSAEAIAESGLLKRQKAALLELAGHPSFGAAMREALAVKLMEQEQAKYDRVLRLSDLVARLGPMFGLLGTLIPLGPGIIALGQGDTFTLSTSLLTAFDTTIAGLSAAAVATVVSAVRRGWYKEDMASFEVVAVCVIETLRTNDN